MSLNALSTDLLKVALETWLDLGGPLSQFLIGLS